MNRLRQLDGLRGCAILAVLVWHYFVCQINVPAGGLLGTAKMWLGFTWSGVDLFFVLSGFLITGILLDNAHATNYFRTFYIRRACRILPIYMLLLVVVITASWALRDQAHRFPWLLKETIPFWAHATFTQNIFMSLKETWGATYALGPTWSLAVEEQFYLVLPVVIYFMPRRVLPILFMGLIILAPLLRATTTNSVQSYIQAPWRADSLISGALLAWCVRQPAVLRFLIAQRGWVYLVFSGSLAGALVVT
jgi:peptidoglycan/LPS O-acetylase OafA/YrhL